MSFNELCAPKILERMVKALSVSHLEEGMGLHVMGAPPRCGGWAPYGGERCSGDRVSDGIYSRSLPSANGLLGGRMSG